MEKVIKNWVVKETAREVAETARDSILEIANICIRTQGIFKIVLAGGTTPELVYSLLASESCDWKKWHLYLGDERCLPIDDPERNSQMVQRIFLNKINIPQENIHFIPAELGAKEAAIAYESEIEDALPFDMVLLGMGKDGHTASLFPEHLHSSDDLVHAVYNAPKLPSERVSLSVKALSLNKSLLVIVTGSEKKEIVEEWSKGKIFPVAEISSLAKVYILLDNKAFS